MKAYGASVMTKDKKKTTAKIKFFYSKLSNEMFAIDNQRTKKNPDCKHCCKVDRKRI